MLKAVVVCSNPWNLEAGHLALQRTWLGSEVYSKTMGTSMRRLFEELGPSGPSLKSYLLTNGIVTWMPYQKIQGLTSRRSGA